MLWRGSALPPSDEGGAPKGRRGHGGCLWHGVKQRRIGKLHLINVQALLARSLSPTRGSLWAYTMSSHSFINRVPSQGFGGSKPPPYGARLAFAPLGEVCRDLGPGCGGILGIKMGRAEMFSLKAAGGTGIIYQERSVKKEGLL